MISSLRRLRPLLALIVLILSPFGAWAADQPAPVPAKLTVDQELGLIRTFLALRGKTTATATQQDWTDAVNTIRELTTPRKTIWSGTLSPMAQAFLAQYVAALSGDIGGLMFWIGVGDEGLTPVAPPRKRPAYQTGFHVPGPQGKELRFAPQAVTTSFSAVATNIYLTGISSDARLAWGHYETSASLGNRPYTLNPQSPQTAPRELPLPAGMTGATALGGSADGRLIVGEGFQGSGATRMTLRMKWSFTTEGGVTFAGDSFPASPHTHPTAVSGDGSTTVGYYFSPQSRVSAWRQAGAGPFTDLGFLPGQTTSEARATTHDGSTVVGTSGHAFRWTQMTAMRPLQVPPSATSSEARSISSDGAFIGGSSRDAGFRQRAQLWLADESNIDPQLMFQAYGVNLGGATLTEITAIAKNPDESYTFAGNATLNGTPRGFVVHLTAGDGSRPVIVTKPAPQAAGAGGNAVFSVSATNATSYVWQRNGVVIPGATGATLTLAGVQAAEAGNYTCLVGNANAVVESAPAPLTVAPTLSRLANVSVRTTAGTAANPLIVGFTLGGGGKNVLLRAVGPTLGTFGVPGTLDDPRLALFTGAGVQTAQNDDWGGGAGLTASFDAVGAFRLPAASKDAVLLNSLPAGGYTAQVSGAANTSGVVLLEAYDSDAGSPLARYTNLSARNQVGTGGNILIVGFNIVGNGPKNLLIRAVGPALTQFGVAGALADPQLAIFNAAGVQVNQNDDWGGGATLASAFTSVGAFGLPTTSKDAALSVTLQPGSYTAQVSGVNNTTGVALAEIYELP